MEFTFVILEAYEQDRKWIDLIGINAVSNAKITVSDKIWDRVMPVAKYWGYKRAGKFQQMDELIGKTLVFKNVTGDCDKYLVAIYDDMTEFNESELNAEDYPFGIGNY